MFFPNATNPQGLAIYICASNNGIPYTVFVVRRASIILNLLMSAVSPVSHLLCLLVFFVTCSLISRKVPVWVSLLLVLLSNDVEINPGPGHSYRDNFFTFMNWNLNSLSKDNFQRVQAIEAHNSLFKYDLISVCETSLNSSIEIPDPLLNNYNFLPANHPDDVTHGGVGLFYKTSLPLKRREDLSFDESIVVELNFGRKKIFFTVLYRSPSVKGNSPAFNDFLKTICHFLHRRFQWPFKILVGPRRYYSRREKYRRSFFCS